MHMRRAAKRSHLTFDNIFGKCLPILKLCHQVIREKLFMHTLQRFPPHLQYVATLPCEIRKSKKLLPNIHVERDNMFN